jgi:hypothetical protein
MDAARSISATFSPPRVGLTVTKTGAGAGRITLTPPGTSCPGTTATCSSISQTYNVGDVVTVTASAPSGNVFVGWGGDCAPNATSSTCVLTMDRPRTLRAP